MKIDVSDIVKENGASLKVQMTEKLVSPELKSSDYVFDRPVKFTGELVNVKGILELTGHLDTKYTAKCYRCLKEVNCEMNIEIAESFAKANTEKQENMYCFEGNYVELDKCFRDNLLLSLPMKHICKEGCKGLCPKCGSNLNEIECGCREEELINPKMEVLKAFFKD